MIVVGGVVVTLVTIAGCGKASHHAAEAKVPLLTQTSLTWGYEVAHKRGLRVSVEAVPRVTSLYDPGIASQMPSAGTTVGAGSTITVTLTGGPLGSPAWRTGAHARVPDFVGSPANNGIRWAERQSLFWALRDTPALKGGNAPTYAGNFVVAREAPEPGRMLYPGVRSGGGFRPTPLTLWLEPRR